MSATADPTAPWLVVGDPNTKLPPAEMVEALRGALGSDSGGTPALTYHQQTPAGTWTITHGLGRRPVLALFDENGTAIDADTTSTTTQTVITFGTPTAGFAELR